MSNKLFRLIEILIIILSFIISIRVFKEGDLKRIILEIICLILFWLVTEIYRKRRFFDVAYIYYLFVIVIDLNISSYYLTKQKILQEYMNRIYLKDYFYLHCNIYIGIHIILILYLLSCKKRKINKKFNFIDKKEGATLFVGLLIVLLITLLKNEIGNVIFIPILNSFFIYFLQEKNKIKIRYLLYFLISLVAIQPYILERFRLLLFIFPLILTLILFKIFLKKNYSYKKIVISIVIFIFLILFYGVISEIIKLNLFYSGNLDIKNIIFNENKTYYFIKKQIFRIFGIWIPLSGNMVTHVYNNGFFYGLSYIKNLANIFNVPYIDIPIISARYIGAKYVQIGLIMEGFTNFGISGAILASLIPFLILDFLMKNFLKKMSTSNFCLMTIPFVKVLLDGGSINSILYNIFICIIIFKIIDFIDIFFKMIIRNGRKEFEIWK